LVAPYGRNAKVVASQVKHAPCKTTLFLKLMRFAANHRSGVQWFEYCMDLGNTLVLPPLACWIVRLQIQGLHTL
jgi:hypothetical protein